ncbi:MAG: hypothetical protein HOM68_29785 [Gemmatimonadetes bacterium]|jgi:spermidine synthase|nr:hypothetical protein [Gemmatimonadota bacterium]MBT4610116.1 hypothetical protein [Gemmatimonadota bacterium]MBT5060774.1 hypothetical protein [Gemmatimonadota bacterium]MBT5146838.1 hypothetical protein [Gemmatimonadota bacterium]MBT5590127.1 hypothetical protein [Gemmatimonadota bacterium]
MNAWKLLGQTRTPDGSDMSLTVRDGEYVIRVNGNTLMSSRVHGSEETLAEAACGHLTAKGGSRRPENPQVLVGGLGMGFTLRATLDLLPATATVIVSELVPAVVEWNQGPLGHLAGQPLQDRRVQVKMEDVGTTLRSNPDHFDAILLDVDNGPTAFTTDSNHDLYDNTGVAAAYAALRNSGTLAVWSAWEDRKFEHRLHFHGFTTSTKSARARANKGGMRHTIFVGEKTS